MKTKTYCSTCGEFHPPGADCLRSLRSRYGHLKRKYREERFANESLHQLAERLYARIMESPRVQFEMGDLVELLALELGKGDDWETW